MNEPQCPVPQNDKERIIKMYNSLESLYIPEFQMQELRVFAEKFRAAKELLREEIKKESYKYWRRKDA